MATAAQGFTTLTALLPGLAFHAVCAVAGVQLCGLAKRRSQAAGKTAAEGVSA